MAAVALAASSGYFETRTMADPVKPMQSLDDANRALRRAQEKRDRKAAKRIKVKP